MSAQEQLSKWMVRFDALTLRERGLVAVAVIAVLITLWQTLLIGPLDAAREATSAAIDKQRQENQALDLETQALLERQRLDPEQADRARRARLTAEIASVDRQLRDKLHGLIPPDQMAKVLEQVLTRKTDLRLYRVQSLPARPLLALTDKAGHGGKQGDPTAVAARQAVGVYRHGLVMEFRGSYLSTLDYLLELKKLPWQFYWDSVDLDVQKYPVSRVVITVHTLSLAKDWIGV